jgi:hypothetical protein
MGTTTRGRFLALALLGALLLGMLSPPSIGAGDGAVYIWRDADGAVRFSSR